jgi:uncharacterized protein YndB with AHSA1/START domain
MGCEPRARRPRARREVERTVDLPATTDDVWEEVVAGDWLGDDVEIDPRPGGALRVDEKVGIVEHADAPRRLSFWWTEPSGDGSPSRVDLELLPLDAGTRLRVRESRPELDIRAAARGPVALARA